MSDIGVDAKNYTALIIDDDVDTVDLFAEFLEVCELKVVGKAFDGKEAIDLYEKTRPDIVFSDVMMPEYDGFYVLDEIKKKNPDAIVVIITGDVRPETIVRLEKSGANAIIYKPFDMKNVMNTVHTLLKKNDMSESIC